MWGHGELYWLNIPYSLCRHSWVMTWQHHDCLREAWAVLQAGLNQPIWLPLQVAMCWICIGFRYVETLLLSLLLNRGGIVRHISQNFKKWLISFVMSVCLHGTARLPLDGFLWNLVFGQIFPKITSSGESVEKYDRARQYIVGSVIRCTHSACWITEARIQTHTQNMYRHTLRIYRVSREKCARLRDNVP